MVRITSSVYAIVALYASSVGAFVVPALPSVVQPRKSILSGAYKPKPRQQRATIHKVRLYSAPDSSNVGRSSGSGSIVDKLTNLFPVWVVSAALLGLLQPHLLSWFQGPFIEAALGATMICMGSTLSLSDFRGVAPLNLVLGFLAQFTIMPTMACASAKLFSLPPAFAAGLILVGCCPGGSASNLVTLIAGADVALSVAMTACSTAAAAFMTVSNLHRKAFILSSAFATF